MMAFGRQHDPRKEHVIRNMRVSTQQNQGPYTACNMDTQKRDPNLHKQPCMTIKAATVKGSAFDLSGAPQLEVPRVPIVSVLCSSEHSSALWVKILEEST